MDNLNFFYTSWKTITDYFINNTIIINDNDDYKTYIEKFLLKYKRLIGLVLLTILLIIGYFEYNINNDNNNKIIEQSGGSGFFAKQGAKYGASGAAGVSGVAGVPGVPGFPGAAGVPGFPGDKKKSLGAKAASKVYGIGSSAAEGIRNNSDWFYGLLYAIAISLAAFMIIIPSISFFVIGIICYFILKDKMKTLKGF